MEATAQNQNNAQEINNDSWFVEEKKRKVIDILEEEYNTCRRNYYMDLIWKV